MVTRVDLERPPVRGHEREPDEAVAGEPELAAGVAVAAAEREPGDAHGWTRARGDRAPVSPERGVDVDQPRTRADRGVLAGHCDLPEPRDVEDDTGRRRVAPEA